MWTLNPNQAIHTFGHNNQHSADFVIFRALPAEVKNVMFALSISTKGHGFIYMMKMFLVQQMSLQQAC